LKISLLIINLIINNFFEQLKTNTTVLEIGPGGGALTNKILEKHAGSNFNFVIVEKDKKIANYWKDKLKSTKNIQIFDADFLKLPENDFLSKKIAVISNLPYSSGTAILQKLSTHHRQISHMTLMFQLEVAKRLYAQENSTHRGSLSLWIQNQWNVTPIVEVPPLAFMPPPKVYSEVLLLTPRENTMIPDTNPNVWDRLLKLAFTHRRKMLRSGLPRGPLRNALEQSGVDGKKRAQALSWRDWEKLYQEVLKIWGIE